MKKISVFSISVFLGCIILIIACNQEPKENSEASINNVSAKTEEQAFGGFENQIAWGKHLVQIGGCHDCHTPKKMGPNGPEDNMDLELSGHPSQLPFPDINRKEIEGKGLAVIGVTFTSFVGPWGVSYAANITSDTASGIGGLTFDQFRSIFKTGKYNGAPQGRNLLPPMPWQNVGLMTDNELEAVFAYLKSTKPINNVVPQPLPPVSQMK